MSADTLSALRKAASILLDAAPLPVVQAALRTLLAGTEAAERSPPGPPLTVRPRGRPAHAKAPPSSSWLALRRRVQAVMRDRGLDVAALARELGLSHHPIRNAISRRVPSSAALTRRLNAADGEGATPSSQQHLVWLIASWATESWPFAVAVRALGGVWTLGGERQPGSRRLMLCGAPVLRGGWCGMHWQRFQAGKKLAGLGRVTPGVGSG